MCKFNLQIDSNWSKISLVVVHNCLNHVIAHETLIVASVKLISMPSFWKTNPKNTLGSFKGLHFEPEPTNETLKLVKEITAAFP